MRRQFEPDEKKKKDDSQFGNRCNLFLARDRDVVEHRIASREGTKAFRAQRHTGGKKTENGAQLQPIDKRNDDSGRRKDDQSILIGADIQPTCHDAKISLKFFLVSDANAPLTHCRG